MLVASQQIAMTSMNSSSQPNPSHEGCCPKREGDVEDAVQLDDAEDEKPKLPGLDRAGEHLAEPPARSVPVRQSTRPTRGTHPNPHHLPTSARQEGVDATSLISEADRRILADVSQTQLLLMQMLAGIVSRRDT